MRLTQFLAATLLSVTAVVAGAQSNLRPGLSTRATVEVALTPPRVAGQPAPAPLKIRIDYGQPHARGRNVAGALADSLGTLWRFGANAATTLTTDVDLTIGSLAVPKGSYSLYTQTSRTGSWELVVNTNTGQWGTEYVKERDLGRVSLATRTLESPIESFNINLIPAGDGSARGELRFHWGTREFSTTWAVR
ncbi:MAG: DUF2911 domain-containing protein [Gemmatimonadota bacterium]